MTARTGAVSIGANFQHIPALDGMRAVAILLVLVAHFGFDHIVPGGFGVTLFFFISGMLITRLLLAEHRESGRIGIGRFYMRRFLRLYPALILSVALSYATYAWLTGIVVWNDVAAALLYYSNYYNLAVRFGSGYGELASKVHIGVLWSLAVEEQYYLVFPLFFATLVARGRRLLWAMVVIAAACLAWRLLLSANGASYVRIYNGTDTRIDSILYGAIMTCLLAGTDGPRWMRLLVSRWALALAAAAILATLLIRDPWFRDTLRYSIQGLALMSVVAGVCFSRDLAAVRRLMEFRPMQLIGAWSYSLYLFHQLGITLAEVHTGQSYLDKTGLSASWYAVAIPVTIVLSLGSYYGVEKPFLRLRHRFGSKSR